MDIADFLQPDETEELIEPEIKKAQSTPWPFLKSINTTKEYIWNDLDIELIKGYNSFIINRALSQHADTLMDAQEMNQNYGIDRKLQYDYLLYSVRKRWRENKWIKTEKDDNVELIQRYYGYNRQKAREVLKLHSKEDIDNIIESMKTGGPSGTRKKKNT